MKSLSCRYRNLLRRVVQPLAILTCAFTALAQNGGVDTSFNTGTGPNTVVNFVQMQPDGRILIGGNFGTVNAIARSRIARLHPNGSVDPSFTPGAGANDDVRAIVVQADGRIILGGDFTTLNGAPRQRIARLEPDGQVDYSFTPWDGANNSVLGLALQADGRVILVGSFTTVSGKALNRIARLTVDGTINNSFDPGTGANNTIRAVALQADGKIIIGGDFTIYDGQARNRIARLNSDGSLDTSFNPGTGMPASVYDVEVDGGGNIYASGAFGTVNGKSQRGLVRFTPNGGMDPTFDMSVGFTGGAVNSIALQPNGQLIAGGTFTTVNGVGRVRVARLNTDGAVDLTFDAGTGPNGAVAGVAAPADRGVLIAGAFTSVAGQVRPNLARLIADGGGAAAAPQIAVMPAEQKAHISYPARFTVVASGNPPVSYVWKFKGNPIVGGTNNTLILPAVAADQAGDYTVTVSNSAGSKDSDPASLIALPEAPTPGSVDLTFNTAQGPNNQVYCLALQTDGRLVIGGIFTTVDGQPRSRVARLLANGSVDPSFAPLSGTSGEVRAVVLQSDGKILIAGEFLTYNGAPRQRIARLLTDGALDSSFLPGLAANNTVDTIALQSDGKILIGGLFTTYGGETRNRIARLKADGTLDATFDPPGGANNRVRTVLVQPNGKIVVAGEFTNFAGNGRNRIVRLNADGTVDETFNVGTGFNAVVYVMVNLPTGVLVGGDFGSYNGATARGLALLSGSGSLSPTFDTAVGLNDYAYAVAVDPDDRLLVGGAFTSANNLARNRVTRLLSEDGSVDTALDPGAGANSAIWGIAAQPDGKVIIGGAFTTVGGQPRKYVARLNSAPRPIPPPFRLAIRDTDDGVRVDLFAERGFNYSIERSANLTQWNFWTNVTGAGLEAAVRLLDPSSKSQPAGFYRGVFP